jgi:excisionase family DNA binding protein
MNAMVNNTVVIPDPETQPLLKPTEVAALMGWSKNTVYELVRTGELGSIKVRQRIYVPTRALRTFLQLE